MYLSLKYLYIAIILYLLNFFMCELDRVQYDKAPINTHIKSSTPSAAYMRQWTRSALVQIMECRLFSAKPLSKPLLGYCQLDAEQQTSVKF